MTPTHDPNPTGELAILTRTEQDIRDLRKDFVDFQADTRRRFEALEKRPTWLVTAIIAILSAAVSGFGAYTIGQRQQDTDIMALRFELNGLKDAVKANGDAYTAAHTVIIKQLADLQAELREHETQARKR